MLTTATAKIDSLLSKLYFPVLVFLCLFSMIHYFRVSSGLAAIWSGWSIGDWVINYDTGPTRRGLAGEIIFFIARVFHLKINWIIFSIQGFALIGFIVLFLNVLRKKQLSFWYVIGYFSPAFFLLFTYYDSMAIGRKEILLYLTFMVWVVLCLRDQISTLKIIGFSLLQFLLALSHEAFFFYSLYFCAAVWLSTDKYKKLVLAIPLSSFIAVALTFLFFKTVDPTFSCNTLLALGAFPEVCAGVLSAGPQDALLLAKQYFQNFNLLSLLNIGAVCIIILLPAYLILSISSFKKYNLPSQISLLFGLIFFSFPLFIFAIDWGRWISMHLTLTLVMLLLTLKNKDARDVIKPSSHLNAAAKITLLVGALCSFALFSFTYSLSHCCAKDFVKPFGPVIKIQHTSVFAGKN
jgi:hypothetical protein